MIPSNPIENKNTIKRMLFEFILNPALEDTELNKHVYVAVQRRSCDPDPDTQRERGIERERDREKERERMSRAYDGKDI